MIVLLWISLGALAVVASLFFAMIFVSDAFEGPFLFFGIVALIVWFCCGVATAIVLPSRAIGRTTCRHWSEQTGYKTKFVILNWGDDGTCLALAPNGRWVKNTQVLSFANGTKP